MGIKISTIYNFSLIHSSLIFKFDLFSVKGSLGANDTILIAFTANTLVVKLLKHAKQSKDRYTVYIK